MSESDMKRAGTANDGRPQAGGRAGSAMSFNGPGLRTSNGSAMQRNGSALQNGQARNGSAINGNAMNGNAMNGNAINGNGTNGSAMNGQKKQANGYSKDGHFSGNPKFAYNSNVNQEFGNLNILALPLRISF